MNLLRVKEENPMFTRKALKALLIPLVLEQFLNGTVGIADTLMVAQVGEHAMSGVSLVDSINMMLLYIMAAMSTGGTVVTAQFLGRRDPEKASESARQCMIVTIFLATVIGAVCVLFAKPLLNSIFGGIEQDVMESSLIYFVITALSYPSIAIFGTTAAIFRATGNSKLPMKVSILMNVMNITGNAIFIFIFNMGAGGAALATLISRTVGGAILWIKLRDKRLEVNIHGIFPVKLNFPMIKNILLIGIPTGIENGIFNLGKIMVQSFISAFGTGSIAAAAVSNSICSIAFMPGMALGMGLVTIAGQCVGAGKYDQAKRYTWIILALAEASIIVISVFVLIFMDNIMLWFNITEASRDITRSLIYCTVGGLILLWPLAFPLANTLRASNDVKFTMLVSIGSMWAFRVGLGYLLSTIIGMGVLGVWIGMLADWLFRLICFLTRFLTGGWTRQRVLSATDST